MSQQTKAPERINLPGGYYIQRKSTNHIHCLRGPGGDALHDMNDAQAKAFAAAMNASSAAPVRSADLSKACMRVAEFIDQSCTSVDVYGNPFIDQSDAAYAIKKLVIAQLEQAGGQMWQAGYKAGVEKVCNDIIGGIDLSLGANLKEKGNRAEAMLKMQERLFRNVVRKVRDLVFQSAPPAPASEPPEEK